MGARTFVVAAAATVCLGSVPVVAAHAAVARAIGDSTVVARLTPRPGYPEGLAVNGNRLYVATGARFGTVGQGPPDIEAFDVRTGEPVATYLPAWHDPTRDHGFSNIAFDSDGRLYVLDTQNGVLRIDTATGAQEIYASAFPDLPPCGLSTTRCTPTIGDKPPLPNDIVFDRYGNAYVSDSLQATIWRIPPGGGAPEVWFQDRRLDGLFGTNGLRLDPTGTRLYIAMTADWANQGYVYTLPFGGAPRSGDLAVLHHYTRGEWPDQLALGRSGRLYVGLAVANQVSVLNSEGREERRFSGPARSDDGFVPYDAPSGITFNSRTRSLLVNNHAEFSNLPHHFVVFDVFVNDQEHPLVRPRLP